MHTGTNHALCAQSAPCCAAVSGNSSSNAACTPRQDRSERSLPLLLMLRKPSQMLNRAPVRRQPHESMPPAPCLCHLPDVPLAAAKLLMAGRHPSLPHVTLRCPAVPQRGERGGPCSARDAPQGGDPWLHPACLQQRTYHACRRRWEGGTEAHHCSSTARVCCGQQRAGVASNPPLSGHCSAYIPQVCGRKFVDCAPHRCNTL